MILSVVAMTKEKAFSFNDNIPWNIPEEFELFQNIIKDSVCIMGRKTFENIKELSYDRIYIVVSKTLQNNSRIIICKDINSAIIKAKKTKRKICILGGENIYNKTIGIVDEIHISWIKKNYNGDRFFPNIKNFHTIFKKEYKKFTYEILKKN